MFQDYKRFDGFPMLPRGMAKSDFADSVRALLAQGTEAYTLLASNPLGRKRMERGEQTHDRVPVGIVVARGDTWEVRPRVLWFSWSSDRNKVETMVRFFQELRKSRMAWFRVEEMEKGFWDYIAHHGVLRIVGLVKDLYGKGRNGWEYQTVTAGDS